MCAMHHPAKHDTPGGGPTTQHHTTQRSELLCDSTGTASNLPLVHMPARLLLVGGQLPPLCPPQYTPMPLANTHTLV
jgi:hypothetical protein